MNADVFLDTGFTIAASCKNDRHHSEALLLSADIAAEKPRVITTRAVMLEIGNALSKLQYRRAAVELLNAFESDSNMEIVEVDKAVYQNAFNVFCARHDKEWGLSDCISYVVMNERGLTDVLTFDEHFRQMGFNVLRRNA